MARGFFTAALLLSALVGAYAQTATPTPTASSFSGTTTDEPYSTPSIAPGSGTYSYIGCFIGTNLEGLFPDPSITSNASMTMPMCMSICANLQTSYAALRFGKQCHCSSNSQYMDRTAVNDTLCNYRCAGDLSTVCGGYKTFTVYKNNALFANATGTSVVSGTGTGVAQSATTSASSGASAAEKGILRENGAWMLAALAGIALAM